MAENTNIEWANKTFNPVIGCQEVSPGCDNCYARRMNKFFKWNGGEWGPHAPRKRTSPDNWRLPYQWAKAANGSRPRVICASLADWLDNQAPDQWREDLAEVIEKTPELDWLLLTKRPENFRKHAPAGWRTNGLPGNIWLGTTCEDQECFDRRWPIFAAIPAAVRFISYEPALTPLRLPAAGKSMLPDWIICGGETGRGSRYMEPAWATQLLQQCRHYGIAFFMKQMTDRKPVPVELLVREFPTPSIYRTPSRNPTEKSDD
jgi:protein gp37